MLIPYIIDLGILIKACDRNVQQKALNNQQGYGLYVQKQHYTGIHWKSEFCNNSFVCM